MRFSYGQKVLDIEDGSSRPMEFSFYFPDPAGAEDCMVFLLWRGKKVSLKADSRYLMPATRHVIIEMI